MKLHYTCSLLSIATLLVPSSQAQSWDSQTQSTTSTKNLTATEKRCKEAGLQHDNLRGYNEHETRGRWSPDSYFNTYNGGERLFLDEPCASARSNSRAMYTSHLIPCKFSFHSVHKEESNLGPLELSTQCSDPNQVSPPGSTTMEDYLIEWPDECVGDFLRCYSVARDENLWLPTFCKKQWSIPEGATHLAVDCRRDKRQKDGLIRQHQREWVEQHEKEQARAEKQYAREEERYAKKDDEDNDMIKEQNNYFKLHQHEVREYLTMGLVAVAVLIVFCSISMLCTYKHIVQPMIYYRGGGGGGDAILYKPKTDRDDSFEMHSTGIYSSRSPPGTPPTMSMRMNSNAFAAASPSDHNLSYRLLPQDHQSQQQRS